MSPVSTAQLMMRSFRGTSAPPDVLERIQHQPPAGFALYRSLNVVDADQVRALNDELQAAARIAGQPRLLIATDQEGGQLMALGDGTPFPGNLALGATRSAHLARETGHAIGRELAATGVNVDFAPVCDVNVNPANPVVGTRSFGESPRLVATLGAAMIDGLQAAGVAATAKHFPGHGDTELDSHQGTPVLPHGLDRLREVELPPFAAAIKAGVRLIMTAHVALPALNDGLDIPATMSPAILNELLRSELGFDGVVISDAMDMGALGVGSERVLDAVAALRAGIDLLLSGPDSSEQDRVADGLAYAMRRGLLASHQVRASVDRVGHLKRWLEAQSPAPPVAVVGAADHRALAREIAARAITLVRDDVHRLPLRLSPAARVAAVQPALRDLTPADTSSYVRSDLAGALRTFHPATHEITFASDPSAEEVRDLCNRLATYDLAIVATVNAFVQTGQAALVNALLERGMPTVVVALRMPYDLMQFPAAPTYLCTYSALEPSLQAAAAVLFGQAEPPGRLPVSIPGLYSTPP
jgi:beta-N-acetylhexosaminidase